MVSRLNSNAWIVRSRLNAQAKFRLFCFPYAGGSAVAFRTWADHLPGVDVCSIELPGRGKRFLEVPFTQLPSLIEALALGIESYLVAPFAFFGHSMGALISFELARYLRKQQLASPAHLFVSAFRAPHLPDPDPPIHLLPDSDFVRELSRYEGTPQEVLTNEELMQLLLPTLRADFTICETYIYTYEAPLTCPLSVFGGVQDKEVSREELECWHQQTSATCSLRMFPGGHFFLQSMQVPMLQTIAQDLTPYMR